MSREKMTGWEISDVRTVDGECMVCGGEGHSFGLIATVTRDEDAHLIAAAPELYEALKLARDHMVSEGSAIAEICDAALSKARQSTPSAQASDGEGA